MPERHYAPDRLLGMWIRDEWLVSDQFAKRDCCAAFGHLKLVYEPICSSLVNLLVLTIVIACCGNASRLACYREQPILA